MEIKISDELNSIIRYAREEAMRTGSYGIGPDHLFLGMMRHADNDACKVLAGLGVDMDAFKRFIDSHIFTNESIPYSESDKISFSRYAQNVLSITVMEASKMNAPEALSLHLLLALCRTTENYGQAYLRQHGVDYGRLLAYMRDEGLLRFGETPGADGSGSEQDSGEDEGGEGGQASGKKTKIEDFGFDLTKAAAEGKLDPVVGRDTEIARVIEILGRRKKNNPMLIGEPGVGKSAIVEGIAQRIAGGSISPALAKKRLISLDIASVVAGTKYRGDFEKRLKSIIKEASTNPDIILFIDEFHTIVGAGGAQGSLDAANMLKPALARGELQCIGATTMDEFDAACAKLKESGVTPITTGGLNGWHPTALLRRQENPEAGFETRVTLHDGEGGLAVYQIINGYATFSLRRRAGRTEAVVSYRIRNLSHEAAAVPIRTRSATLAVRACEDHYEFLLDGREIARLDSALLSTEVVGGFTGVTVGMYCAGGSVSFDYFNYRETY